MVNNTGEVALSRRWRLAIAIVLSILLRKADGVTAKKVVTHYCLEVPDDPTQVRIETRILINDDPVFKVYAFDAASGDTSAAVGRTLDVACIKEAASVADKYTEPLLYDFTVTTTDASHPCGVSVETDSNGLVVVTFVFRIYAHSDAINTNEDEPYEAICRMDDLTGAAVSTGQLETIPSGNIIRQQQSDGAYLRVRSASDLSPVVVAKVGDQIILSIEFYPNLQLGPDNYGSRFFIGFLGIDPISGTTSSEQYIIVIPRYSIRTDILITTIHGEITEVIEDGTPRKIVLYSDLMGCSDDGDSEIQEKGVEIYTYDMEVGVLVCSKETGTADCYTALPVDVTGKDYVTSSMFAADEASELMVIAQEDGTTMTIDIPDSLAHIITSNGTATTAGGDLTVTLDKRMAFHLAQKSADAGKSTVNGYHITTDKPVSVISGTRRYANDHLTDQMSPTTKFGTHYVLIPVDITQDNRATTYIIQAVTPGDTTMTRYLDSSSSETHTVTYGEYLSLDVASGAPCELIADKPVMVTQVVNAPVTTGFDPSMVIMPAVRQWAPKYIFHHSEYSLTALTVFKSETHTDYFRVNGATVAPQLQTAVNGPNGFFFGSNFFGQGTRTLSMDDTTVVTTFMAIGYMSQGPSAASSIGAAVLGWGYVMSDRNQCVPVGRINDLLDNDCDGLTDEERLNGIDDDGDGEVDEDASGSTTITEHAGAVAIRPINCRVSADTTFTNSLKSHTITGTDGCAVSRTSKLFEMASEFTPQAGANIGTGILPKVLHSGIIEVSQYIGEPQLNFMCDITYCISASDTDCTLLIGNKLSIKGHETLTFDLSDYKNNRSHLLPITELPKKDICESTTLRRKRRDDEEQSVDNITSNIWVFPYDTESSKPDVKETQQEASLSACMDNEYIQMSLVSLGGLAVVSFFTAMCFCYLFRTRRNRDKEWGRGKERGRDMERGRDKERGRDMYYNGYRRKF